MGYEIDFIGVGQEGKSGDAILLRYGNLVGPRSEQVVVLIDGGFKDTAAEIKSHLEDFYSTKSVDLVISTHPDSDHINGLHELFDFAGRGEISIGRLWIHRPSRWRESIVQALRSVEGTDYREAMRKALDSASELELAATKMGILIEEPFAGLSFGGGPIVVLGPSEEFYASLFQSAAPVLGSLSGFQRWLGTIREYVTKVLESWDIETLDDECMTSPTNNSSVVLGFFTEDHYNLFTSDVGCEGITQVVSRLRMAGYGPERMELVQVPHHGSRRNVGPTVLDSLLGPRRTADSVTRLAIVSCATNGAPKHPSKKVTNAFQRRGRKVYATMGQTLHYQKDAPTRNGWSAAEPVAFFDTVED